MPERDVEGGGTARPGGERTSAGSPGRVPPYNLQAEESLLGAMLLSKDAVAAAAELVTADDFYKPGHGHIYDAVSTLTARGEPVDPVTVADELRRAGLLEMAGGATGLLRLQANTPATSNASRYARIVEEHALLRRLISVAGEISELGYSLPEDVTKAIDTAESMVYDLSQHRITDSTSEIGDMLGPALKYIEDLHELRGAVTGTPTGYVDLDNLLGGLQREALVVVGARPAMGKTAFALGMAAHAAMTAGKPVVYFSLEMGRLELSQRLLCSEARVDSSRIRSGRLDENDWSKITGAVGRLGDAPIWLDDNPNASIMEIRGKCRRLASRVGDLGLVVVDYIQLMTGRTSAESRQVEVAEISRGLKILARELKVPVVALAQLNRGLEQRADKRPMLSDLRESGALEQDADVVMFIYRDEVYNVDSPDQGIAEVLVAKHRAGPTGVARLAFLSHYTRFANMASDAM